MIENRDLPVGARLALPDSFVPSSAARNGCIRPINADELVGKMSASGGRRWPP